MKRKFEYLSKFVRICRDHVTDRCHCYCWVWMPCVSGWSNGFADAIIQKITFGCYGVYRWKLHRWVTLEEEPLDTP